MQFHGRGPRGCGAAQQSGVGDSGITNANDKDPSKPECCAIESNSEICGQCHTWLCKKRFQEHMVIAAKDVQDGSLLHASEVRNLIQCEARGCQLCHTVLASIRLQVKVELPDQELLSDLTRYSLYLLPDVPGWTIKIVFQAAFKLLRTDLRLVQCDRIRSEDNLDTPQWVLDQTIVGDGKTRIFQLPHECCSYRLDAECVAAQIKTWFKDCKSLHQNYCGLRKGYDDHGHNFRLLFLGDEQAPCARIVDANTMDSKTEYVTLSHRWHSSTKATETILANILGAYQNISLDAYPKHFREAMSLTKRLGFKYVWIDSLCIIQDCREDWSKQAPLMHQIYSNGALNLALLQNFTHHEPPSQAHARPEVLGCNLPLQDASGFIRDHICWKPENFDYVLQNSPLYSRGWTFQERALSPRTVHFGKQLYWECCSLRASTSFPFTVDYPGQFADESTLNFKQLTRNPNQSVAVSLHGIWCSVVRDYSARDFTKPSDIPIALSGVAQRLQHVYSLREDEYFYGLWKPCLPDELLWGIEDVQRVNIKQTNAGPSWSWVSHTLPSRFVNMHLGSEYLRERLAKVIGFHDMKKGVSSLNLDASSNNTSATLSLNGILIPSDSSISTTVSVELDYCECEEGSNAYLLPILRDTGTIYGLLLQSVRGEGDIACKCSTFRRLGLFQGPQTTIEKALYKRQPSMQCLSDWATMLDLQGSILTLVS